MGAELVDMSSQDQPAKGARIGTKVGFEKKLRVLSSAFSSLPPAANLDPPKKYHWM